MQRLPNPRLEGSKKSQSSCPYPSAGLAEESSFQLFLRLEGLGTSRFLLLPLMGLGRVRARELKSEDHWIFSGPRIYPMEHPALDPASASALETAGNMPHWG